MKKYVLIGIFLVVALPVTCLASMPAIRNLNLDKDIYDPVMELSDPNFDEEIKGFEKELSLLRIHGDSAQIVSQLHAIARRYINNLEYVQAYDAVLEALDWSLALKDSVKLSTSYKILSEISWTYGHGAYAKEYIAKAIAINKNLTKRDVVFTEELIRNYYYASIIHRQSKEYKKALVYADSCIALSEKIDQDTIHRSYHHSEKAIIYIHQGRYGKGEKILVKARDVFEALNETPDNKKHVDYLVFIYCYLGKAYYGLGELELSREYFYKGLYHSNQYNGHLGMRPYILYRLSFTLNKLGELKEAFKAMSVSKEMFDQLYGINSGRNRKIIDLKSAYEQEIKDNRETQYQNTLLLAKQETNIMRIRLLITGLFVLIVLGLIMLRIWKQRVRLVHEKEIIARENDLLDKASHDLIQVKNKELTTYTLQLIEKDKIIKSLMDKLRNVKGEDSVAPFLKTVESKKSLWNEFNHRFNSVNNEFYERLSSKYPDLSSTDLKHCALIKLNFSSKEMSHLLGISHSSVNTSRHRIRKKMNLGRDDSLTNLISTI